MDSVAPRVLRAIQDSSSSAAASSSDSNGGRAGAGTGSTPVGAAEGAVGLLLFFADMVFSRGLHVALSLSTDILYPPALT